MAIRIEQLDVENIAKYFVLRAEMERVYGKEYLINILSKLTVEEKRDLGLGYFPYEYNRLQELIQLVERILEETEIGDAVGQYPQDAHDDLSHTLQIVKSESTNKSLKEISDLYTILRDALTKYLSSENTEDNFEFGGKSYGYNKPEDDTLQWVPGKVIGCYWISLEPLPEEHPNYQDYTHYIGLYIDGFVFSRNELPVEINYLERIDGAYWDYKWFSMYEEYNHMISHYIGKTVGWIPSNFIEVDATNINFINATGKVNVWWGREYLQHFVPTNVDVLEKVFNVVSTMGMNNIPDTDILFASVEYLTDNANGIIGHVGEGVTVADFMNNLILPTGATVRFYDPVTMADLSEDSIIEETTRAIITSKDRTVQKGLIIDLHDPQQGE